VNELESDEVLVRQYRQHGDERAFEVLVRRYQDRVFRLAAAMLGPALVPEAEDVVQEVFVRVHGSLDRFRGDSKFSTWLYRIAYNLTVNARLRAKSRRTQSGVDVLAKFAHPAEGPAHSLEEVQRREVVEVCIGDLPLVYQTALRLHYWQGASAAESAEMLSVPENTLKSYLHRARKQLAHSLKLRGIDHE
jgi:RNA polymerase sigma-70 factor (ECF subfamily)